MSAVHTAIRQNSAAYSPLFDKCQRYTPRYSTRSTCTALYIQRVLAYTFSRHVSPTNLRQFAPQLSGTTTLRHLLYTAASLFCFAKAYNNARPLLSKGPATPGYPCAGRQPHPLNNQNKTSLNNENKKQSNGAAWVLTEVLANVRRKLRRLGRCLLILRLVLRVQCPCPSKALPLPLTFNGAVSSLAAMRSRFVKRT